MTSRYAFVLALITLVAATAVYAETGYVYEYEEETPEVSPIPELTSLMQVADAARAKRVPILVEFSTPWCSHCTALEENVLKPLILNGKFRDQIIIRKLEVNSYSTVPGFDGKQYSSDEISRMYQVDLYPTLVFFDADGREVSQRIVGITVLEYVAGRLEEAIDRARQAMASAL